MAGKISPGRMTGGARGGKLNPKPPKNAGAMPFKPAPQPDIEATMTGRGASAPPPPPLLPFAPVAGTNKLPAGGAATANKAIATGKTAPSAATANKKLAKGGAKMAPKVSRR